MTKLASHPLQKALYAFIALYFAVFLLLPLVFLIRGSIASGNESPWALFQILLTSPGFYQRLLNSINLALVATALSAAFSLPLAFLTARFRFPGRTIFQSALYLPMIVPPFVGAIGIRRLFSRFGPVNLLLMHFHLRAEPIDWLGGNGFWSVAVVQALHLYPILYLNLSATIGRLDPALEEAAANFGATPAQTFRRIALPLLQPAFFAGGILVFTWSFTDLGTPLIFDYRPVLAVQIYDLANQIGTNPLGYALVTAVTIICLALFVFSQRFNKQKGLLGGSKESRAAQPRKLGRVGGIAAAAGMTIFIAIAALPHIGVLISSIAKNWFMTVLPETYSFEAYRDLLSHPLTAGSIRNSLILSFGSTALDLMFGLAVAWLLARGKIKGLRTLDLLTMAPLAVPGIVMAYGYLSTFSNTILDPRINPLPLLALAYALRRLPFMVRTLDAGFKQCNVALEDAAASFGAGPITTLRRIVAPILMPHLLAGAILCFCFAMLEVSESMILAVEERYFPITKAMYALLGRPDGQMIASALGVVSMLLIILCLLVVRKLLGSSLQEILRQ